MKTFKQWQTDQTRPGVFHELMNEEDKVGINIQPNAKVKTADGKDATITDIKDEGGKKVYTVKDSTNKETDYIDAEKDKQDPKKRADLKTSFQLNVK